MSGVGKWVKKHPAESIGILATLGTAGAGAAGMGPLAGLLGGAAAPTVAGVGGANVGAASAAGVDASLGASGGLFANVAKAEPLLKMASMMNDERAPMQPNPLQLRGPGQPMQATPMYGDPAEEERRRRYMAMMAQQSGGYGSY